MNISNFTCAGGQMTNSSINGYAQNKIFFDNSVINKINQETNVGMMGKRIGYESKNDEKNFNLNSSRINNNNNDINNNNNNYSSNQNLPNRNFKNLQKERNYNSNKNEEKNGNFNENYFNDINKEENYTINKKSKYNFFNFI